MWRGAEWLAKPTDCARPFARFDTARLKGRLNVKVPGKPEELNVSSGEAGRVADFLGELGELMCIDALTARNPAEVTSGSNADPEGETLRHDDKYALRGGLGVHRRRQPADLHKGRPTTNSSMKQRSYK